MVFLADVVADRASDTAIVATNEQIQEAMTYVVAASQVDRTA